MRQINKNADHKGRHSLPETELQYLYGLSIDSLQALRTQMHALGTTILHHRPHQNTWLELPIGAAF